MGQEARCKGHVGVGVRLERARVFVLFFLPIGLVAHLFVVFPIDLPVVFPFTLAVLLQVPPHHQFALLHQQLLALHQVFLAVQELAIRGSAPQQVAGCAELGGQGGGEEGGYAEREARRGAIPSPEVKGGGTGRGGTRQGGVLTNTIGHHCHCGELGGGGEQCQRADRLGKCFSIKVFKTIKLYFLSLNGTYFSHLYFLSNFNIYHFGQVH